MSICASTSRRFRPGIGYDVYDTDAHDRTAPDALGVLSHYKAIVWYTGDNVRTIEPDQPPTGAGASKLSDDEFRAVRDFLNEGGKLLYTGKRAGWDLSNQFVFNAQGNPPYCNAGGGAPTGACIPLSNDFLQYYLGSYGNNALRTNKAELDGVTIDFFDPMEAPTATLNGGDSADNQDFAWTLTPTSTVLPADKYPQFKSTEVGDYSINGPLAPKTGDYYMYSQVGDHAYKRLTRTIDLTAKPSGTLRFSTSYDLEPDYDYMFVEAHTVGSDADWTTLPDENGNTSTELDPTAGSCSDGWAQPDGQHPWLAHYVNPDTCDPHGTADTLYFGFGLEGVQGAGTRNEIMKSAMRYLGILNAGGNTPQGGGTPSGGANASGGSKVDRSVRVSKRTLRVDRRRRAKVKLYCGPTAGKRSSCSRAATTASCGEPRRG